LDQVDQVEESAPWRGVRMTAEATAMHRWVFAGAGAADEDCIALSVQEGAGGEFAKLGPSSIGVSAKVKRVDNL